MVTPEKSKTILGSFVEATPSSDEVAKCEIELQKLGFSEQEIDELNSQLDGIIERGFDRYLSNLYE